MSALTRSLSAAGALVSSVALVAGACGAAEADPTPSVVHVSGEACGRATIGGGVVVDRGLVLTNAHVVAGVSEVEVNFTDDPTPLPARLVAFDPNRDLALLEIATEAESVELGDDAAGTAGRFITVDGDGQLAERSFVIQREITATGEDIYRETGARRRALEVELTVAPGESGSGLFDAEGRLVGVVFASSRTSDDLSYAVARSEVEAFLAEPRDGPVDPGPCV